MTRRWCGEMFHSMTRNNRRLPIRPENKARYPKDWKAISQACRDRAGNRCEGSPAYPDCRAKNGMPHPETGSVVVLTTAHLDHTPENCADDNLKAWCQRCHNTYDAPMRRAGIQKRQREQMADADLFDSNSGKSSRVEVRRLWKSNRRIDGDLNEVDCVHTFCRDNSGG